MALKIPAADAHIEEAAAYLTGILNAFRARGFVVAPNGSEQLAIIDDETMEIDGPTSFIYLNANEHYQWKAYTSGRFTKTGGADELTGINAVRAMDDLRMAEIRELRKLLRRHHHYIGLTSDECRICDPDKEH